jgi:hypothetical protein
MIKIENNITPPVQDWLPNMKKPLLSSERLFCLQAHDARLVKTCILSQTPSANGK